MWKPIVTAPKDGSFVLICDTEDMHVQASDALAAALRAAADMLDAGKRPNKNWATSPQSHSAA